jgi:DNA repair exonuclease SbcCD ATPase subunit
MRYVHFKHLKAFNFLSIGKKPVEIDYKPGLNIITGKNYDKADRANGVGKSTIADAMHFALFGNSIRELKKENIVNDQAPEALCEVELDFDIHTGDAVNNYKIIRTINPTKCYFFENGVDMSRSGIPQTTELIVKTIGTTSEIFQNTVIMTLNSTIPFMAQKKVEKRKFIEGILGLEVFGNMLLLARTEFNEVKKSLDIEDSKLNETARSLLEANKQKDTHEESKKKRLAVLLQRQKNNEQELVVIKEKLNSLESVDVEAQKAVETELKNWKDAKVAFNKKVDAINKSVAEANANLKFYTERLKKLQKTDSKCPHCGGNLNIEYEKDKAEYEKCISDANETLAKEAPRLDKARDSILKIEKSITDTQTKLNDFLIRRKDVESNNNRIKQLNEWLQSLVVDIDQLNNDSNNFQEIIDGITARQEEIKKNITAFQEKLDIIESAKYIASEEGVKSFIVKKILQVLNTRLAFYLRKLESNSIVTFNEYFEETITNERGSECSYFNFSGAERKAIDLAMLFTFQDIRRAQADVWINLSMFDELLDSSLDDKGIELVLDILKDRVDNYNESIYIISHRKESKKYCIGGEIVYLEKRNGITTRTTNYDIV